MKNKRNHDHSRILVEEKNKDVTYVNRYGVYAIPDDMDWSSRSSSKWGWFLLKGEIGAGEIRWSSERELIEELGLPLF